MHILWVWKNRRIGKAKFNSLRILLDPGTSSSFVLGKHTQKLQKRITKSVIWSTKAADFHKNSKINVETSSPKLDAKKTIIWNFHINNSPRNHKYYMIIGGGIFSKLQIVICFYDDALRGNRGAYSGCKAPMKGERVQFTCTLFQYMLSLERTTKL